MCARLLCAPLSVRVAADGLAGQWCKWMTAGGLAVVRLSLNALPADESLFSGLISVLLRCTPEEAADSTCSTGIAGPAAPSSRQSRSTDTGEDAKCCM